MTPDYEELDAVRNGTAQTTPAEEDIPDWHELLAAGLVTYEIDDARRTVTLTDVTWTG